MRVDLLSALNVEREARRACAVVTDMATGEARLVRAQELAQAPLNGSPLGEALAIALRDAPQRHAALKAGLQAQARERLRQHGVADLHSAVASLALDIELNAQGLGVWLDRATR